MRCAACASPSGIAAHDVVAAGVHGQTVRHRPQEGWTLQINNPARVAEHAYMTVVADFRMRDIAAGGQGAPLVPAFHAAMFGDAGSPPRNRQPRRNRQRHRPPDRAVPCAVSTRVRATCLLDLWCARQRNAPFDAAGAFAASGTVDHALLDAVSRRALLYRAAAQEHRAAISSTRDGSIGALAQANWTGRAEDVQATLAALTARTLADAVRERIARERRSC